MREATTDLEALERYNDLTSFSSSIITTPFSFDLCEEPTSLPLADADSFASPADSIDNEISLRSILPCIFGVTTLSSTTTANSRCSHAESHNFLGSNTWWKQHQLCFSRRQQLSGASNRTFKHAVILRDSQRGAFSGVWASPPSVLRLLTPGR